jgi:hypothetical protein
MRERMGLVYLSALALALAGEAALRPVEMHARQAARGPRQCTADGAIVSVRELPEGSGLAASRRSPGRFWSHNDSGKPVLVALDASGSVTGRVRVENARVEDWEAVATGRCAAGTCIYIGDIGDNDAERDRISVYRIPEPSADGESTARAEVFHASYPDGAHDAETLLAAGDGRLFVVTKGETGPVAIYAFPRDLRPGSIVRLERVGGPPDGGKRSDENRITDGSVSPDGEWIVLRSLHSLTFHRAADLLSGKWDAGERVSVASVREPQGEGVAFADAATVYLAGEGGGKSQPGSFARLTCR